MLAPVVIFVYNRLEHTQRLVESLAKNTLAAESEIFIFSDAAKNDNAKQKVDAVREYIKALEQSKDFKSVKAIYAENNQGLAKSVISGVDRIIQEYGKVIVLEDDLVLSPHFLEFMNQSLEKYQKEPRVFSVSGFSRDIEYLRNLDVDMYFAVRAQSWSWGTWLDRWEKIDWDVKDYNKFKYSLSARSAFNAGGDDMSSLLDRQQCGKINSWAIRFCYAQYKQNAYTVQPRETLVGNCGQDGSGTHCNYVREKSELSQEAKWDLRPFSEDTEINAELKRTRKKIPWWKLLGSYLFFVVLKRKVPFV
ncbi:glycosyltransferase family 2 protein [uncultured Anaerovibrio sp.]|uniref:glycosyltransferase family 2 protein n=1 Tax=uncultured Anaerovibrio sp. TaxID=361586 RepID=UPI002601E88F|nr:glycosyltransferase family A protein [uncultured Anaerovibrio sp.]